MIQSISQVLHRVFTYDLFILGKESEHSLLSRLIHFVLERVQYELQTVFELIKVARVTVTADSVEALQLVSQLLG